jgi:hypothetical protein
LFKCDRYEFRWFSKKMPRAVAVFATPPEDVAISAALTYNPLQSRPARHAVAVLMLLKNKRKPQKASLAGPAVSQRSRVLVS